jgi:hypothetical protein
MSSSKYPKRGQNVTNTKFLESCLSFLWYLIINRITRRVHYIRHLDAYTGSTPLLFEYWNLQVLNIDFEFWCLNATFNNISAISWRLVLVVEETGGPGENHWPVASHWQTWSHNVVQQMVYLYHKWHLNVENKKWHDMKKSNYSNLSGIYIIIFFLFI